MWCVIRRLLAGYEASTWETRSTRLFARSEEHTSELQSRQYLVCRLLLEKKKNHALPFLLPPPNFFSLLLSLPLFHLLPCPPAPFLLFRSDSCCRTFCDDPIHYYILRLCA